MTQAKDKRIEEGRKLLAGANEALAEHEALGPYTGDRNQGHPEAEAKDLRASMSLSGHLRENARYFLYDLPRRIEELEEGFRRIQAIERAQAPDDDEYGYLTCNADGFNIALQECQSIAASLISEQPETGELADSYLYHNPDSGWEISANHPVDSGEVPDADHIEPISAQVHNLLTEAWSRPDTPQAHGDVERVEEALMACLRRGGDLEPDNPEDEANRFWEFEGLVDPAELARTALSAMRPVSVDREGK